MYIDVDYISSSIQDEDLEALTGGEPENLDIAIKRATGRIDFYLANQYTLPIAEVPEDIKGLCLDLTIYFLHTRTQSNLVPEMVAKKYDDAIVVLKDIASGKGKLPFTVDPKPEKDESVITEGFTPVMSRGMF